MRIPTEITPCPIIETIAEVRFKTKDPLPVELLVGLFHSDLIKDYPNFKRLPILDMPEAFRGSGTQFEHAPNYNFSNSQFQVNIGPKVISLCIIKNSDYPGWEMFKEKFNDVFKLFLSKKVHGKIERVSLRYSDYFNDDIFQYTNAKFSLNDTDLSSKETHFRSVIEWEDCFHILQITNTAKNDNKRGSLIDIDSIIVNPTVEDAFNEDFELMHDSGKHLFFNLLGTDFLKTLNLKYDE